MYQVFEYDLYGEEFVAEFASLEEAVEFIDEQYGSAMIVDYAEEGFEVYKDGERIAF